MTLRQGGRAVLMGGERVPLDEANGAVAHAAATPRPFKLTVLKP